MDRQRWIILGAIVVLSLGSVMASRGRAEIIEPAPVVVARAPAVQDETLHWDSILIEDGDTFAALLERISVPYSDVLDFVRGSEDTFDFTMIRSGRSIRYVIEDGALVRLAYDIDTEEMVIAERTGEGFVAERAIIPYVVERIVAEGTIATSLYEDGLRVGMPEVAILRLAEAFEWTIDFATQVQKDDAFRVLYESRTRNGVDAGVGAVLAAEFINAGKRNTAFLFENADGDDVHFDADGNSLTRALLRSPLAYGRVTSGFTYARFHPTLGRSTPHRAIDYAAPMGTPIRSVGNGTVRFAGWNGGYGNYISVRHNDTYETHYAHLSGYARGIRAGAIVTQGQTIGYVGSTGFSTGPHVHYEVAKWGTLINPLTLDLPPEEPVPDERRAEFEAMRDALETELLRER
jgi:murein DD-endopeptidase MepM/ murein hydrolase activator NlpD